MSLKITVRYRCFLFSFPSAVGVRARLNGILLSLVALMAGIIDVHARCTAPSFAAIRNFPTALGADDIVAGDFNHDGLIDLATPNSDVDSVSVLIANGNGGYLPAVNYGVGDTPIDITLGDVNLDGNLDLVVANFVGDSVSILLGASNGTFGTATNFPSGNQTNSAAIGDFNLDGKPDLAIVRLSGVSISILTGNGTGTFSAPVVVSLGGPTSARVIHAADFNLDGKLDLAVASSSAGNRGATIMLGNGTGGFTFGAFNISGPEQLDDLIVVDLNQDGRSDVITGNFNTGGISVLLGAGSATLGAPTTYLNGSRGFAIAAGDFNQDGKLDVAVSSSGVRILLGDGSGVLGAPQTFGFGNTASVSGIVAADFNFDGKFDVAVSNSADNQVIVRHNSCGGATEKPKVDFDGDGVTDIAVFRPSTGFWFILQSSDSTFQFKLWGQNGDIPAAGDFDGDDKTDFVVFRPSNGFWFILRSSDNVFTFTQFGLNGDRPASGDYDGDGIADFAVFRPSAGTWFILESRTGQVRSTPFGAASDIVIQ